ncbi:MAG TPA: Gfo/Idh/MocA family oxidoreductase, partial [Longimicrobiales bacterium]
MQPIIDLNEFRSLGVESTRIPAVIADRKIRFGLVGCGRISYKHIEAFQAHHEFAELTAVCDNATEALRAATQVTGATAYQRYEELLADSSIDVVVLATPSGLHAEQGVAAAAAGKHVVTEKPMATRWNDGLRLVKACDEAGVRLFVVKQNRRNATLQFLKRAIEQKRFGRIFMVNLNVFWNRPQSYYDSAAWRGTWEFDGGAFMNQASHYVDLLDWLVGPVQSVHAFT